MCSIPENTQEGLTDDQVRILKNLVGGEKSYDKFLDWAINNLNEKERIEYDQLVDSGDFEKIKSKMLYYFSKFEDSQNQNISIWLKHLPKLVPFQRDLEHIMQNGAQ